MPSGNIENVDAVKFIKRIDKEEAFFYINPLIRSTPSISRMALLKTSPMKFLLKSLKIGRGVDWGKLPKSFNMESANQQNQKAYIDY